MANPFIGSLPLMAATLGRKYGVKVFIGGEKAASDGRDIYLPALPLDSPPDLVKLARGYLDHESAHIRATDFDSLKKAKLKPIERHVWNMIEDYRVERLLGDRYPGCRQNFEWLIRRFFDQDSVEEGELDTKLLNWLLLTVRSWSVSELGPRASALADTLEQALPGLPGKLSPIINEARVSCPNTRSALRLAKRIVQAIDEFEAPTDNEAHGYPKPEANNTNEGSGNQAGGGSPKTKAEAETEAEAETSSSSQKPQMADNADNDDDQAGRPGDPDGPVHDGQPDLIQDQEQTGQTEQTGQAPGQDQGSANPASILKSLLTKEASELPQTLEELSSSELNQAAERVAGLQVSVARESPKYIGDLSSENVQEARRTMFQLKTRLQSLLQGLTLEHSTPGQRGRLEANLVHRIFLNSAKIFRRPSPRVGLDAAVHLLLDSSGSMGNVIHLTSLTAYSLCDALAGVPGVNVAATAFPGGPVKMRDNDQENCVTVTPLLRHGEAMSKRFRLFPSGTTPLAQALWWVLQEMAPLAESRKIIFIVTDGFPDSTEAAQVAIAAALNLGLEIYGLGMNLGGVSVMELLPGRSVAINNLSELPQKLFGLLGRAINNTH
jgi:cobalamin biosynthesis protein CobT